MKTIDDLLEELYAAGLHNDASTTERVRQMLNITPSTGRFLDLLIRDARPRSVLEIGTSNGYSTIWLARACREVSASLTSIECDERKVELARANLEKSGLASAVEIIHGEAGESLHRFPDKTFDLVFLDSDRRAYVDWLPSLIRVTRLGQIVVDNATTHPQELAEFRNKLEANSELSSLVLPIGNGQLIVTGFAGVNPR